MKTLVWFRGKDLRLRDHAPLRDALEKGEVVPLFVLDPYFFDPVRARELPNRMQYLLDALHELEDRLIVVKGKSVEVVPKLAREWKVDRVVAHRWVEPFGRERDRQVAEALHVPFELFEGETLLPPGTLRNGSGEPYSIYTPFSRSWHLAEHIGAALPAARLPPQKNGTKVPTLEDLGLTRNPQLIQGGEKAAQARLAAFVKGPGKRYAELRNRLDLAETSRLSADLKFGTLSARQVWNETEGFDTFRNELVWREYAHSTLWDHPEALKTPLREAWRNFPFRDDRAGWTAWSTGTTGYPVVDAAQRQLLGEGFIHNRARMITASFLTRDLMIDFRKGEAWFMKWLVDGDWANNDAGWQWSFGCGLDAQPYFRVFAPVPQGEKFDPTGEYVRRWVPELARVPQRWLHSPWLAPPLELMAAGVKLGSSYPHPIVDHADARQRFLSTIKRHLG
ncbi:MAG: deoxyribodipyrimidine photo-lyase [Myxococcaceae bacterium]|nr:deoxyribodipyrimidine photo-lyase [Myxococcaceae bacterium]